MYTHGTTGGQYRAVQGGTQVVQGGTQVVRVVPEDVLRLPEGVLRLPRAVLRLPRGFPLSGITTFVRNRHLCPESRRCRNREGVGISEDGAKGRKSEQK